MKRYYYAVTSAVTTISNAVNTPSSALHKRKNLNISVADIPRQGTAQNIGPK
jgi:hypothetical protein